jgi:Concanavalin A-like lectin/glucanases superfamily
MLRLSAFIILFALTSLPSFAQSGAGNCLHFNGKEYVTAKVQMDRKAPKIFTLEARFKSENPEETSGMPRLLAWNHEYSRIEIGVMDGRLTLVDDGLWQTNTIVLDSLWHHVAYVRRHDQATLYFDGEQVLQITTQTKPGRVFYIGSWYEQYENWRGCVDEVRVWKVARTPLEIKSNPLDVPPDQQKNLLAWYRFNQGIRNANNTDIATLFDETRQCPGKLNQFDLAGFDSNFVGETQEFPAPKLKKALIAASVESDNSGDVSPPPAVAPSAYAEPCPILARLLYTLYLGAPLNDGPEAIRAQLRGYQLGLYSELPVTTIRRGYTEGTIDTFYFKKTPDDLRRYDINVPKSYITFESHKAPDGTWYLVHFTTHIETIGSDVAEKMATDFIRNTQGQLYESNERYVPPFEGNNPMHQHFMSFSGGELDRRCGEISIFYSTMSNKRGSFVRTSFRFTNR